MHRHLTAIILFLAFAWIIVVSAAGQSLASNAATLFQGPNGTGAGQAVAPGSYKVDGRQLAAAVGKNAVFSVMVSKGSRVRFCEDAAANGGGKCEEFGEGIHNLASTNFALIKVWKEQVALTPVIVFEAENWLGRSQVYFPGMYRSDRNEFGKINDDMAKSVIVSKGFRARFCEDVGIFARGDGGCEEHTEGRHNLRFADSISFIEVFDLNDKSPPDDSLPVILYEDKSQGGKRQGFDVGMFLASKGQFGKLSDNTASSITVKKGYRASICPDDAPNDNCEDVDAGKRDLRSKDTASFIRVWKEEK